MSVAIPSTSADDGSLDVEADHGHGAERGFVGGRDDDLVAVQQRLRPGRVAVDVVRRDGGQPVLDGGVADDVPVALQRALGGAPEAGLDEVEVGQRRGQHEPDVVVVLDRADQGGVEPAVVDQRGGGGVGDVVGEHPGVAEAGSVLDRADDHDHVAGQHQLGAVDLARQVDLADLDRLGAGHVVDREVLVEDPHHQLAVGLDGVGLVDAGLLHVGAGGAAALLDHGPVGSLGIGSAGGAVLHRAGHRGVRRVVDGCSVPAVRRDPVGAAVDVGLEQRVAAAGQPQVRVDQLEGQLPRRAVGAVRGRR